MAVIVNNEVKWRGFVLLRFNLSVAYPQHKNIKQNKQKLSEFSFSKLLYIYTIFFLFLKST